MNAPNTLADGRLRLADHVRSCVIDDQVVLLDLRQSRYHSVNSQHWEVLRNGLCESSPSTQATGFAESQFAPLVHRRILTTAPITVQPAVPRLPAPVASFEANDTTPAARIRLRHLIDFAAATALAALWLRLFSMGSITQRVHALHSRCRHRQSAAHADQMRRAVVIFDGLRPLVFTSKEKCLYDSLALVIFLARQGLAARWVIGVTTRPFRAHAWVQDGCEVLNDLHENVRRYTPIHSV